MDSNKHPRYIAEQLSQLRDLLVVIERTTDAPDVLYKIAIEKSQHITALVEAWRAEVDPSPVEIPAEYALWAENNDDLGTPVADTHFVAHAPEMQSDVAYREETTVEPGLADSVVPIPECGELPHDALGIENTDDAYIAPFIEENIQEQSVEDNENASCDEILEESTAIPADDVTECKILDEEKFVDTIDDVLSADERDDVACNDIIDVINEQIADVDDDDDDNDDDNDDDDDDDDGDDVDALLEQEYVMDELYNRGEPFDTDTITIGEMMSVRQAKELRKALSLNDRFRFRRELFGNSDVTMNDTLNLIDTMHDYDEAFDYLTHDLEWSIEEPVVQEFLQLIERHFKK